MTNGKRYDNLTKNGSFIVAVGEVIFGDIIHAKSIYATKIVFDFF